MVCKTSDIYLNNDTRCLSIQDPITSSFVPPGGKARDDMQGHHDRHTYTQGKKPPPGSYSHLFMCYTHINTHIYTQKSAGFRGQVLTVRCSHASYIRTYALTYKHISHANTHNPQTHITRKQTHTCTHRSRLSGLGSQLLTCFPQARQGWHSQRRLLQEPCLTGGLKTKWVPVWNGYQITHQVASSEVPPAGAVLDRGAENQVSSSLKRLSDHVSSCIIRGTSCRIRAWQVGWKPSEFRFETIIRPRFKLHHQRYLLQELYVRGWNRAE